MIVKVSLRLVEAIKLHRTDTTLDLSQKAEKGMSGQLQGPLQFAFMKHSWGSQVWVVAFAIALIEWCPASGGRLAFLLIEIKRPS